MEFSGKGFQGPGYHSLPPVGPEVFTEKPGGKLGPQQPLVHPRVNQTLECLPELEFRGCKRGEPGAQRLEFCVRSSAAKTNGAGEMPDVSVDCRDPGTCAFLCCTSSSLCDVPCNRNGEQIVLKIAATRETTVEGFVLQDRFCRNMRFAVLMETSAGAQSSTGAHC